MCEFFIIHITCYGLVNYLVGFVGIREKFCENALLPANVGKYFIVKKKILYANWTVCFRSKIRRLLKSRFRVRDPVKMKRLKDRKISHFSNCSITSTNSF